MYGRLIAFLLTSGYMLLLSSCEKTIDFKLEDAPPKLVVEATIENGQPPIVFLTTSLNYFAAIDPTRLIGSFVHDAEVFVSDGSRTHRLKEFQEPLGNGRSIFYYSIDSSNLSTAFVGQFNHAYQLSITWQGDQYTATTTILNITRRIDSLWWAAPPNPDSTEVNVLVRAYDPPGFGDYIRYFSSRNGGPFLPGQNSVYDDLFIDGTSYELQVEPGVDRNQPIKDKDRFFYRGDTVLFKLSNIDKATYDFWRTMEFSYASVGNPFSTPVKVLSNISNGALGYFGGYASQYHRLIIPH